LRVYFDNNVPRVAQRLLAKHEARDFILALLLLFGILLAASRGGPTSPERLPPNHRPTCSPGAICFSGEVRQGQEFRWILNADLEFVLEPGWTITIVPRRPNGECREFAYVVNPPYDQHRDLDLNVRYGWTAESEVAVSPRVFRFVTNCSDQQTEAERLDTVLSGGSVTGQKYDDALSKLGTSSLGQGRLWITDSRISRSGDTSEQKSGAIERMSFTVEIRLPR
jgi:hypothetical protein